LSSSDFQWDEKRNEYRCPQGWALRSDWRTFKNPRSRITKDNTVLYKSMQSDCTSCPMKSRCCPNFERSIAAFTNLQGMLLVPSPRPPFTNNRAKTKKKVEMLFAHLKRIMKLDRLRLRGPSGAHDEFILAATAQNLRRMAKRLCLSPPIPAFGAA
jgi:hypothetical protein